MLWMWSNRLTDRAAPAGEWSALLLNDRAVAACLLTYTFFELRDEGVVSLAVETKTRLRMHFTHAIVHQLSAAARPPGRLETAIAASVERHDGKSVDTITHAIMSSSEDPWAKVRQLASTDAVDAGCYVITDTPGKGILGSVFRSRKLEAIPERAAATREAADRVYARWHRYRTEDGELFNQVKKEAAAAVDRAFDDGSDD